MKLQMTTIQETPEIDHADQIEAAGRGFLTALVEARKSRNEGDQHYWLNKAKEFKEYLELLGASLD